MRTAVDRARAKEVPAKEERQADGLALARLSKWEGQPLAHFGKTNPIQSAAKASRNGSCAPILSNGGPKVPVLTSWRRQIWRRGTA